MTPHANGTERRNAAGTGAESHGMLTDPEEASKLFEELRGLAIEMHRRCYSHVPDWRPSKTARGVLSQIDNMVAGMMSDIATLKAAVSWIEPPFVDDDTSDEELRRRVGFAVKDANRIRAARPTP
jgi:hypothetical protein